MEHAHTPGPWFVDGDTEIVLDSGHFIATAHDSRSMIGTADEYANARLMAQSPALLEIAEQAFAAFQYLSVKHPIAEDRAEFARRAEHARAIIHAATTEE